MYNIVLIHGLWMTPLSWQGWKERFESRGHNVLAPGWPGIDDRDVQAIREDPRRWRASASRRSPTTTRRSSAASTHRPSSWATRSADW